MRHQFQKSPRNIFHFTALLLCLTMGFREHTVHAEPDGQNEPSHDPRAPEVSRGIESAHVERENPFVIRPLNLVVGGTWIGAGVCYGPYRDGQEPGGKELPSQEQIAEDLELMLPRWRLLRVYGSAENAENMLQAIHQKKLPFRVMLGAWIASETIQGEPAQEKKAVKIANQREVHEAIRLANAYPEEVIAINVGNESQVFWSTHRTRPEILVRYLREVRSKTRVPVTTADDFKFWTTPESKPVAEEIDFIVTHIHPMWAGCILEDAMPWTQRIYSEVRACHPGKVVLLGETGWATRVHDEGEQAKLIKGKAGEQEQRLFHHQFTHWIKKQRIGSFYFQAFDEKWKGGSHPDEVEKHWGLFRADRTPKAALTSPLD